ncbi:hypothetical protein D9599_20310 [Roseomonas sp. KE2513]|uniref:hypothetical protein n=1 Tax=Roseomonas sp. KE2513 TaxID=2479202 RepID=UPI0018DF1DCE|nr:hypothetical protein [Roseomonas sp. KE2513]MBI0537907.1 hypothetical protein [Roseomonas sp. KE2513]
MISESARATTAAESAFRIRTPNAAPRATLVVALDQASLDVVEALSARSWNGAVFFAPSFFESEARIAAGDVQRWFRDVVGRAQGFVQEVETSNQAVMIATSGQDAQLASVVGDACRATGTKTCGLILHDATTRPPEAVSATLGQLRPYVSMLSVVSDEGYIEAMLEALRA